MNFSILGTDDQYIFKEKSEKETMSKRTCLMIDDDVDKKLRLYQAKLIKKNQGSFSYSKVINLALRAHF